MRTFFILGLVLIGHGVASIPAAWSQQADECKLCRDDYRACKQAHSEGACKTNYDICMKYCRKK